MHTPERTTMTELVEGKTAVTITAKESVGDVVKYWLTNVTNGGHLFREVRLDLDEMRAAHALLTVALNWVEVMAARIEREPGVSSAGIVL